MTFEFDRYINGQLMAEGVTIERQGNLPDAMREAARIASRGPNGEVPVLVLRAEALSRTGAVKVKALEWEERKTRLGTVWWSAPNPLGGLSIEAASENDKIAAQADYERRILSTLTTEPTAPEGRQDDDRIRREMDEILRKQSERDIPFAPSTRPAEQAVTDEMVEAAVQAVRQYTRETLLIDEHRELVRTALKAAMEAGHD